MEFASTLARPAACPVAWLLLTLLALGVCFIHLGLGDVLDISEGMRVQPAREMLENGDWIVPRIDGKVYIKKPPLLFWIIAASYRLRGGATLVAARAPVALLTVLTILLTAWVGWLRLPGQAGLWAGAMMAANYYVRRKAQQAEIDPVFALAVAAGVYCFWLAVERKPAGWWRGGLLAGVCMGLAFMLKGPVIFPFLLAAGLAFCCTMRPAWRRMFAPLGLTVALAVAIAFPWCFLLIKSLGWDYVWTIFHRDSLVTVVKGDTTTTEPIYYYLVHEWVIWLPWILLLFYSLNRSFRSFARRENDLFYRFAAWFSLFSFVIFSLSKAKETTYLMPIFPFLALTLGLIMDWLIRSSEACLWHPAAAFMALAALAGCLAPIVFFIPSARVCLVSPLTTLQLLALPLVSVFCLIQLRRGLRIQAMGALVLILALAIVIGGDGAMAGSNKRCSPQLLTAPLADAVRQGAHAYRWKVSWAHYVWYLYSTTQPLPKMEKLQAEIKKAKQPILLVTPSDDVPDLLAPYPDLEAVPKLTIEKCKYGLFTLRLKNVGKTVAQGK